MCIVYALKYNGCSNDSNIQYGKFIIYIIILNKNITLNINSQ